MKPVTKDYLPRAENYQWCEDRDLEKYIKFSYFHKEQKRAFKKQIHMKENWKYRSADDTYRCPKGRRFEHRGTKERILTVRPNLERQKKMLGESSLRKKVFGCDLSGQSRWSLYSEISK